MLRCFILASLAVFVAAAPAWPQARRRPAAAPAVQRAAPEMTCPAALGMGLRTRRAYCDVLTGNKPETGILIKLPPHSGPATLIFDLHNRQTYSEEQVKAGRGFARYMATIGVLSMDSTWVERASIQSEFRNEKDLIDRIEGGAGPKGVKAVAPTGTETVHIKVPANFDQVSILGERLLVERVDGRETFSSAGRPIAVVSNVTVEYRPAPARRRR